MNIITMQYAFFSSVLHRSPPLSSKLVRQCVECVKWHGIYVKYESFEMDFGEQFPQPNLVPGDIYEISDPHLTIFPCDALLLAGDAIVNESMLTGESVPVSKLPCVRNEVLHLLSLTTTISPELAKHFLFSGTKVVRVRSGSEKDAGAAIAMVVRTGFNTTKGSLVRSMLFPRPNKFRFYRDSFRFIGVMALIAGLGFVISIVNFINLGVLSSLSQLSLHRCMCALLS